MASMVYLVGAGPGDPGLVTVKGLELIKKADCIIYDRLSSPELLGYAGMDCERIYVGKADRHHTLPQEQINELLVEKAKEYAKNADLILYVADSSGDLNENDAEILDLILDRKNVIVLLNKSDLEKRCDTGTERSGRYHLYQPEYTECRPLS